MRPLGGFCIALLCAGGLSAQFRTGQGTVVHNAPATQGHGPHSPQTPRWPYQGYGSPGGGRARTTFVYPVVVGGGFYDYGGYGYGDSYAGYPQQQPNVTIVNPQEQPPVTASPVIINIGFPPAQSGSAPAALPPSEQGAEPHAGGEAPVEPTHYLIALKDHTIYSAVAYWVDNSTLHYFTSGNTHNQISLSLVDRDLTHRLNQGSGLQVNLPPAR